MPAHRCKIKSRLGYKWGESGKCYVGFGARRKAERQAAAIYSSGYTGNSFCPTGPGGGIDPTCGPGEQGEFETRLKEAKVRSAEARAAAIKAHGTPQFDAAKQSLSDAKFEETRIFAEWDQWRRLTGNARRRDSKPKRRRGPNPLRADPTRTATTRRLFIRELRKRVALLKRDIVDLVVKEDAFGLTPIVHSFCPTGEGGGVDPTCSPGRPSATFLPPVRRLTGTKFQPRHNLKSLYYEYHRRNPGAEEHHGKSEIGQALGSQGSYVTVLYDRSDVDDPKIVGAVSFSKNEEGETYAGWYTISHLGSDGSINGTGTELVRYIVERATRDKTGVVFEATPGAVGFYEKLGFQHLDPNMQKIMGADATTIKGIRKSLGAPERERSQRIAGKGVSLLTSNVGRFAFRTTPEKVEAFRAWLKTQTAMRMVDEGKKAEDQWWRRFVEEGYRKGAGRAFDDTRRFAKDQKLLGWHEGTQQEFLRSAFGRPVSVEKVKLLAGRTYTDLKGVTDTMATRVTRALTDGMAQGMNPREIARKSLDFLDAYEGQAETVARTEVIRAHAEGQLDAMEMLGVERVGVMVEWATAEDDRVCEACSDLEGIVVTLDEARGMIPRHPNCRCAYVPANVGEGEEDQVRGQRDVEKAIGASVEETGGEEKTSWTGADKTIAKDRPESLGNAFCPTGEGGGIDPTCSPPNKGSGASAHDFGDGPVEAKRHTNQDGTQGGWVAASATIMDNSVYIAPGAKVYGKAVLENEVKVLDNARVFGSAHLNMSAVVSDRAQVSGKVMVSGIAQIQGDAQVRGSAFIDDDAVITDRAVVEGAAEVRGQAYIGGDKVVGGGTLYVSDKRT